MTEPVLVRDQRHAILVLRMNRPDARNALNAELVSELGLGFLDAERDPEIRCIVLTGTGDRAFCAGMDLADFASGAAPKKVDKKGTEAFGRFMEGRLRLPIVGAAQATAVAGGFELLLACDVVVASESAKFGLPEVKRGLFPAGGGIYVGNRIPLAIALEPTLTGDLIDASRALALGLVNQTVPADEVLESALSFANRIARNWPLALQATKELVRENTAGRVAAQGFWEQGRKRRRHCVHRAPRSRVDRNMTSDETRLS